MRMAFLGHEGMLMGMTPEEFSDESLFGEDKIEDLLEKKNSFIRGAVGNSNVGESFSKGGSPNTGNKGT